MVTCDESSSKLHNDRLDISLHAHRCRHEILSGPKNEDGI